MYVYLYKTTNRINDKYYIGIHKTNLDPLKHWDGYLGSGTLISRAINKYGKKAFDHQLLAIFGSREMACDAERAYIATCIDDPNCYNLAPGGEKGWNETLEGWRKRDPDAYFSAISGLSDKMKEVCSDTHWRSNRSKRQKEIWKSPEYLNHQRKVQKEVWADPKIRVRASKTLTEVYANPGMRKRCSENTRKRPLSRKDLELHLRQCKSKIMGIVNARKNPNKSKALKEAQLNRRRLETLLDLPHTPFTHVDLVSPQIQ